MRAKVLTLSLVAALVAGGCGTAPCFEGTALSDGSNLDGLFLEGDGAGVRFARRRSTAERTGRSNR